jgi:hypothetical protein
LSSEPSQGIEPTFVNLFSPPREFSILGHSGFSNWDLEVPVPPQHTGSSMICSDQFQRAAFQNPIPSFFELKPL